MYPDFVMMAKSCGVPGRRVIKPADLRPAIQCAPSYAAVQALLKHLHAGALCACS